jgi:hypothetical protein
VLEQNLYLEDGRAELRASEFLIDTGGTGFTRPRAGAVPRKLSTPLAVQHSGFLRPAAVTTLSGTLEGLDGRVSAVAMSFAVVYAWQG